MPAFDSIADKVKQQPSSTGPQVSVVAYLITLCSGGQFVRFSDLEPKDLTKVFDGARKDDDTLVWFDDEVTVARQVADISPLSPDDPRANRADDDEGKK